MSAPWSIRRHPTICTVAGVGDVIVAYGQTYCVVSFNDWGQAVCHNLNEECLAHDEYRTFDDYDIERVVKKDDPVLFIGQGI